MISPEQRTIKVILGNNHNKPDPTAETPIFTDLQRNNLIFPLSRQFLVIIVFIVLAGSSPVHAVDTGNLTMYCWLGYDAIGEFGGVIEGHEFNKFFLAAVKIDQTTIDIRPTKETILNGIKTADIIYTNTHSGYPRKGTPRMILLTGEGSEISSQDLQSLFSAQMHQPSLVIINGCNTLSLSAVNNSVMKINEGFGITNKTKNRAYIGFNKSVEGIRGDVFFRIFFSYWTRTPYPTLDQARKSAIDFFKGTIPEGQKYLDPRAAEIGDDLIIVGDDNLTFGQVLSGTHK